MYAVMSKLYEISTIKIGNGWIKRSADLLMYSLIVSGLWVDLDPQELYWMKQALSIMLQILTNQPSSPLECFLTEKHPIVKNPSVTDQSSLSQNLQRANGLGQSINFKKVVLSMDFKRGLCNDRLYSKTDMLYEAYRIVPTHSFWLCKI